MLRSLRYQFILLSFLASATSQIAPAIRIDGRFEDWQDRAPILQDDPTDSPQSLVDFGDLQIAHDQSYIYFAFTTGSLINLQAHRGSIILFLDFDGTDLQVQFSSRGAKSNDPFGRGVKVIGSDGEMRSAYELGTRQAPTHAARRFELRFDRNNELGAFQAERLSGKLVFRDSIGRIGDETEIFHYRLDAGAKTAPAEQAQDPLVRSGELRVLGWNTEKGSLFARPAPFARILEALDPDILMLQEIDGAKQTRELASWFEQHLPGIRKWNVLVAAQGGDLRSALVSRLPIRAVDLGLEAKSAGAERSVAALIQHGEKRLLAISLHLRCCGHLGSYEDLHRRRAAVEIREAVDRYLAEHPVDGVIFAGDLNLVGSREPLELLITGSDFEGGDLRIAESHRLDDRLLATWRGPHSGFLPGRLDYILHSKNSLAASAGLIFASEELAAPWRELHGIESGDSRAASDHLPLVCDFSWR